MTEKRKPGRPPTQTIGARAFIVRARVSESERDAMQAAADAKGQPLAVWAYERLVAAEKASRRRR